MGSLRMHSIPRGIQMNVPIKKAIKQFILFLILSAILLPAAPSSAQSDNMTQSTFDGQAVWDLYANQTMERMSDQSIIFNPDGTIKQVITGKQPMASPTVTSAPVIITVTVVPSGPVATKAQPPVDYSGMIGAGIAIMANCGIVATFAYLLIFRKK